MAEQLLSFPFPLEDGAVAELRLPRGGLTRRDARRLQLYVGTLVPAADAGEAVLPDALRGTALRQTAVRVLREREGNEPIHYRDWFALVELRGRPVGGQDPVATLLATIARADEVERVGGRRSGMYRLREAEHA